MSFFGKRPRRLRKRSDRNISLIGLLLVLVVLIALVNRKGGSQTANASTEIRPVESLGTIAIPVPSRPIARGEKIGDVPFSLLPWPSTALTTDTVREVATVREHVALAPLPSGVPVAQTSLGPAGSEGNAVVERIPDGMRAITVRVDAESAVEGWARSGNFVDVILIRPSTDSSNGLETKVIAENVRILSAGSSIAPLGEAGTAPKPPSTITLLTSQEDALRVKTAANVGKLAFSLRGQGDISPARALTMSQRSLLGQSTSKPEPKNSFQGVARGPDGHIYVLDDERQWLTTNDKQLSSRVVPGKVGVISKSRNSEPAHHSGAQ